MDRRCRSGLVDVPKVEGYESEFARSKMSISAVLELLVDVSDGVFELEDRWVE